MVSTLKEEPKVFYPTIRSTPLKVLDECRRKFMFEYRMGLKPRGSYSSPLGVGEIYHIIQACQLRGENRSQAFRVASQFVAETHSNLVAKADPRTGYLPGGKPLESVVEQLERDHQVAKAMACYVWDYHPFNLQDFRVLSVERLIEVRIKGVKQPIRVKADLLLVRGEEPPYEVWIVDHKTTGLSPVLKTQVYPFDVQPRLYRLGLHVWLNSKRSPLDGPLGKKATVAGCIHSVIQRPTIRLKQSETFDDYLGRVADWYKDKENESPGAPPYLRSQVRFHEALMTPELMARLKYGSRMSRIDLDPDVFWRNESACVGVGKSTCPFLPLCRTASVAWPNMIEADFEISHRDVDETPD